MSTALFALGYLVLFLGLITFMVWLRARSRQDRAPFPENTRLLRGPGESLTKKLTQLAEQQINALLFGLGVPLVVFGGFLYLATKLRGWPQIAAIVGGLLVFLFLLYWSGKRVVALLERERNTRLGLFGERIVAEHLEPLKAAGHRVFHDVPAGDPPAGSTQAPFNLDHVVVGPAGVFAIETKTRRKGRARVGFMAHEIIYDGRALAYPWGEDQHGLEQARRQAEWLAKFLHQQVGRAVPVHALLVFPGWMIIRKGRGPVNVLNPRELPAALSAPRGPAGAPPALDEAAVDLIARQLEARCRDVEL